MSELQQTILATLDKPRTRQEIINLTGLRERVVKEALQRMKEQYKVHIADRRGPAAVYAKGAGDEYSFNRDKSDEIIEGWFRQPVNVVVRRDPLVAALFGHSRA